LRDSVQKGTDAATFTHNMNKIYIRMAGPNYNARLLLLRNVVLRRFIFDNPHALWAEEDPNQDDPALDIDYPSAGSSPEVNGEPTTSPPPPKKRRTVGGRVAKGQDFWSLVDAWFISKQELGKKLTDPAWKKLLEEYVQFDEDGFQKRPQPRPHFQRAATSQTNHITGGLDVRGSSFLALKQRLEVVIQLLEIKIEQMTTFLFDCTNTSCLKTQESAATLAWPQQAQWMYDCLSLFVSLTVFSSYMVLTYQEFKFQHQLDMLPCHPKPFSYKVVVFSRLLYLISMHLFWVPYWDAKKLGRAGRKREMLRQAPRNEQVALTKGRLTDADAAGESDHAGRSSVHIQLTALFHAGQHSPANTLALANIQGLQMLFHHGRSLAKGASDSALAKWSAKTSGFLNTLISVNMQTIEVLMQWIGRYSEPLAYIC
ncbi:hypothetical protein EV359DRAFT_68046, partial [Lentinula novae-zelandiae]